ncbi:tail fiber domain-containing protein [Bdellovibrio sp. BCCA]|uniref:tail fiber domain-containing protein n=1 Tax=Bdellovibrio sp. BCCA TaxID=3136281 RepID=UPI0030F0D9C3
MAHKFIIAFIIGMAEVAFAGNSVPQLIPFQGRLTDTGGVPINTPVTVKYRIYPPTGSCYLYEDTQSVSPNAFGIFSVLIGATGHSTGPGNNFANIFNNSSPGISDSCSGVYVPVANDWRRIEVLVDGVPFSDMQTVGAAPFSFNTNMLEGKRAADFIAKDATVTQAALTSLLNGSDASSLHNHDSLYAKIDGSNSYTGNISTTGNVGVGTSSATADVDIQKNSPRLRLGAATGAGGTSSVEFYSGTTTQRARIESNENSNGLKFYTGSAEAMSIDANKNVYVGGSLKVTGTVGVGAYTAAQDATLVGQLASLGVSATGSMWIQSTSGQLRYWDGTAAKTLLPQGTVIETSAAFGGDVSGTYTNLTVNKIKGRVVDDTGLTANKILKYDGAKWVVADDGVGWTASDASYSAKGIVQFDTDATTSGLSVASGVASVNTGTTANKIVKLDGAAKLPGVDGSQLTNILATDLVSLLGTGIVQKNGAGSYSTVTVNGPLTYTAGALGLVDSGVTAGTYSKVTVDTKGRVTVGANIGSADVTGALGYTPLNKAGDVMTGSIGLGNYTNATEATLISGYGSGDKGKTWFNSTTGQVKYWDGTAAKALGISGAGLTSLGGQTGSTQTFSTGTAGTAPAWSSGSDIHTLNIPMASGAGTTAGLLSNADYVAFNSKQVAGNYITALTGDVTASGPGSAATTIAANAVTTAKILDGTILGADLNYGGVNTVTSGLVIKDNTGKFFNFNCGTTGDVATWTATGWACQAPTAPLPSCAANEVLKWNGTGWACGTDNAGTGTVTGVTATAPLASSGGAAPVISISNGTTAGQTLRWGGASWVAAQLSDSDITGLGTLATKNSVDLGTADATGTLAAARMPALTGDVTSTAGSLTTTLANSGVTAGTYSKVTVDAKGRVTVGATISSSDVTTALTYTPLNKAGDVMTGTIGLGNYTNATEATLIAGFTAADKGKTWFNSTTGQVKYWDGAAVKALGISGAGLTSLGGQTGSTQTFAIGTTGTAPGWSSGSDVHTLNIPMAATAGTTAGLLSKTDYDAFNSKQAAGNYVTALTGDVTASGPGSAAATIAANAITTAKILDGTILGTDLNYGGVNLATSGLVIKDNTGKFFDFACGTTGNVATWTATGWACQAPTTYVTGVTATAPLASSGGAAPVISISNGSTTGQTLRWGGASWTAAQLSNSDITGLGTLATKNSVASADITDGTITGADVSTSAALSVASVTTSGNASVGGTLTVTTSISAPSYNYTSDRRLKKDIVTMSGLDTILKLRGVRFNWIKDGKPEVGLIAQEVEQVEPDLVVTDERTGFKAVKYGNVVSPLIEATKELYGICVAHEEVIHKNTRDVASLKAEVQELKKQNEDLRKEIQEIRNMIMEQKR